MRLRLVTPTLEGCRRLHSIARQKSNFTAEESNILSQQYTEFHWHNNVRKQKRAMPNPKIIFSFVFVYTTKN